MSKKIIRFLRKIFIKINSIINKIEKTSKYILGLSLIEIRLILLLTILFGLFLIGQFKIIWIGFIPPVIGSLIYFYRYSAIDYNVIVYTLTGEILFENVRYKYNKKRNIIIIITKDRQEHIYQNCQFSVSINI